MLLGQGAYAAPLRKAVLGALFVGINRVARTSDLPLRERPRGVSVGYGTPATIVVNVIVRFAVC